MKKIIIPALLIITAAAAAFAYLKPAKTEPVVFAYFSGYRCPPCMKFKQEYLNDFKNTYKEKYKGHVEYREYMTDIPLELADKTSPEYKAAKKLADQNTNILGATSRMHNATWVGSIPFAVIGESALGSSSDKDKGLNKENVERAIEKALKNNETTKLSLKSSGKTEDYADIIQAARAADYKAVKAFLDKGANVDQVEIIDGKPNGYTALIAAAFAGNMDIIELLLSRGANINAETNWKANALGSAAFMGRPDIVEFLISKGALMTDNNIIDAGVDENMIKLLIKHGANINGILPDGNTPLTKTIINREKWLGPKIIIRYIEVLINQGADVNKKVTIKDDDGKTVTKTPLQLVQSKEVKDFLISKGAK